MPFATQPNITLTTDWTVVATGASSIHIQNLGTDTVIVSIGSASPAANTGDGDQVARFGSWDFTNMSGETVYARAQSTGTSISVTKA